MTEYAIFEDGLCIERGFHTRDAAEAEATDLRSAEPDCEYVVHELCPDHADDEQTKTDCENCAEEEASEEDDQDEDEVHVDITPAIRTPYDAEHVAIVDMGRTVWALYIPDSEQARDPQTVADNICDRRYEDVEMVATMSRIYKRDGASYSGWLVESGASSSDCVPRKREAMKQLRLLVSDYFNR